MHKSCRYASKVILVVACVLSSSLSYASDIGLNVSALLGADFPSINYSGASLGSTAFGYGGRIGYTIIPNLEVGASVTSTSVNPSFAGVSFSSVGINTNETFITGDVNYHFSDNLSPLYVGIRLGVGITSVSATGSLASAFEAVGGETSGSATSFAYGVVAEYEIPIASGLSIGPRVSYMIATPTSVESGSISDFQAHAAIRYAF